MTRSAYRIVSGAGDTKEHICVLSSKKSDMMRCASIVTIPAEMECIHTYGLIKFQAEVQVVRQNQGQT